jgi:hypothetical protein
VLTTTRRLGPDGFGEKARELDDRKTGPELVSQWRERWAELTNEALERAGSAERVDHRSLEAQRAEAVAALDVERADALDRAPEPKLGWAGVADLRRSERTGEPTRTDRAERWLDVRAQNVEHRSVLRELRGAVRDFAAEGIEAFKAAAERVQKGIEAFQARAAAWLEQQKGQTERQQQGQGRDLDQTLRRGDGPEMELGR